MSYIFNMLLFIEMEWHMPWSNQGNESCRYFCCCSWCWRNARIAEIYQSISSEKQSNIIITFNYVIVNVSFYFLKVLCAQEEVEGHNELMAQMFSVMEPLVSYGFYWEDKDVREIIGVMIYILDGETDKLKQSNRRL